MRAFARAFPLPADAAGAVDDRRLLRRQPQAERDPLGVRLEDVRVTIGLDAPIIDPDAQAACVGAGLADACAGDLLRKVEPASLFVREREMGKEEVADQPARRIASRGRGGGGTPEERELKTERPAVFGPQVAGVVPPFSLEIVMRAMIVGESELVAGKGGTEFSCRELIDRHRAHEPDDADKPRDDGRDPAWSAEFFGWAADHTGRGAKPSIRKSPAAKPGTPQPGFITFFDFC